MARMAFEAHLYQLFSIRNISSHDSISVISKLIVIVVSIHKIDIKYTTVITSPKPTVLLML